MKTKTMIETFDDVLHDNPLDAKRHLLKLYGEKLCHIGRELAKIDGKYSKTIEWIDENLGLFVELKTIKADIHIESPDSD